MKILYATLMTCPWYACTQKERGEQAKHNSIFVVYQSSLERFLAPVNAHLVDQTNVVDKVNIYCIIYNLSIGTPYLLNILVLKSEIVHSTTS